ncbi:DUF1131 family protein [Caulobacter sp. SL161]|uniref:DUF1131 family protein n=1 Tax=Caulobacter sp. SL161 TaxID=2995156 RepID=UPI002276DF5F|nr:DUF1131 family protein [Caulobacter sp. SL161]MCY1646111.1 DUF1131 family protein [Caulobacter sp. SL161]
MTPRHSDLALPLLLLAACGPAKTDQASKADDSAKGPVTVAIAPYAGGPLKISNDGAGPINASVAFDLATLKVLFPKAKVEQAFLQSGEGPALPIITLEQDNTPLAEIGKSDDGDIGYVRVEAGDARGPKDEQLLAKWGDLGFSLDQCRAGAAREINMTICVRPDAPQVSYVFGVPGWTKAGLPPEAFLKAKGQLNALIWRPAEGAVVGAA